MNTRGHPAAGPFKGPAPLDASDRIYGRDSDLQGLTDILLSDRIVLLYSPSGAGKTSLIEAGFDYVDAMDGTLSMGELKGVGLKGRMKAHGFKVLPSIRVSEKLPPEIAELSLTNHYIYSVLHSLEKACFPAISRLNTEELASIDLNTYLQQRSFLHTENKPVLLVFDQFEEVLTDKSTDIEQKRRFFAQLGEGLRDDRFWALFAMREGYIANLDNYLEWIPTGLASRFRLDLLTPDDACLALSELTRDTSMSIDQDACKYLVYDLTNDDRRKDDGKTPDIDEVTERLRSRKDEPLIEPLHLQVVGRDIWMNLPPSQDRITADLITSSGGVDKALISYYEKQVLNLCLTRNPDGTRQENTPLEYRVRSWFENALLTRDKTRALVDANDREIKALRTAIDGRDILTELGEAYLIREEVRPRRSWYELAHDRMIQPMLRSNKTWFQLHLEPVQRRADQWSKEGKPDNLLFSGLELTEAKNWLVDQKEEETKQERLFVDRSMHRRNIRRAFSIFGIVLVGLTISSSLFSWKWYLTVKERDATVLRNRAMFLAAAAQRQRWVHHEPETASLLARQAHLYQQRLEDPLPTRGQVNSALRNAVFAKPFTHSITIHQTGSREGGSSAPVRPAVDPNDHRMAITDGKSSTTIIGLGAGIPSRVLNDDIEARDILFNPGNGDLVLLSEDQLLLVNKQDNIELRDLPGVDRMLAFDNSGSKLLTSGDEGLRVWDSQTWSSILLECDDMDPDEVRSGTFSSDGTRLAVGTGRGRIVIWDISQPTKSLWEKNSVIDSCEDCRVVPELVAIGLGPQGKRLITIGSVDGDIQVWDLNDTDNEGTRLTKDENSKARDQQTASTGRGIKHTKGTVHIKAVAFDLGLSKMATGDSNGVVREWVLNPIWDDKGTALRSRKLDGRLGPIKYLGFSDSSLSPTLLVATDTIGTIRIYEPMDGGRPRSRDRNTDTQKSMKANTAQARYLEEKNNRYYYTMDHVGNFYRQAVASDSTSLTKPETVSEMQSGIDSFDVSGQEALFALAVGNKVMVADLNEQHRQPYEVGTHHTAVRTVRFTGKDFNLLSGDRAGNVKLWQLKTPTAQGIDVWGPDTGDGENSPVTALAAYPEQDWVAVGFESGRIDLLSMKDGHPVPNVAISPHAGRVTDLSFAANGDYLASSSSDSTIQLWRTKNWEHLPLLRSHTGEVRDIDFDDMGKQLVSGGDDGIIRIWPLVKNTAPTVLSIPKEHGEIVAVDFTQSGEKAIFIDVRGQAGSLDIVPKTIADMVCKKVWRNLSKEEWERFIPDTEYECTCPELGPGPGVKNCP